MSAYYQFVRGGSWDCSPKQARVALRIGSSVYRFYSLGFRIAKTPLQRMAT